MPSPGLSKPSRRTALSKNGPPLQLKQSSRRGKREWRKNVDLQDLEEGLEEMRAEERVTGSALQNQTDEQLFQVDLTGDAQARQSLSRFSRSRLTSTKILAQRSAVPAVFSRPLASATKRKVGVARVDKDRLLRLAKRPRKGPFNAMLEPEPNVAEITEAVKHSGHYDPWAERDSDKDEIYGLEFVKKKPVKAPIVPRPLIELSAIEEPHQGTSYNPAAIAHQELLLRAHAVEEKRLEEEARLQGVKGKMEQAKLTVDEDILGVPPGMKVDEPGQEDSDDIDNSAIVDVAVPRPLPKPKTKQQRNKAARREAEKRALAAKLTKKRLLASIDSIKSLKRAVDDSYAHQDEIRAQRRLGELEKLKGGLAGMKIGRHKVPPKEIDVQLGEDLSESLRELKPEGNMFRDRLRSLQHRALVEPRAPVLSRRPRKVKEYEKHAWKRFDRES